MTLVSHVRCLFNFVVYVAVNNCLFGMIGILLISSRRRYTTKVNKFPMFARGVMCNVEI